MASAGGGAPGVVGGLGASSPPPPEASRRHHSLPPRSASPEPPSEKEERVRAARAPAAMASAGGGAPGAVDGLGASSPPRPRPRRAAPARAVVAFAAHGRGDLRESLREVLERILAEGCVDVMSAASCVGASSSPPPPPPRRAATPPALLASHGHGGVDLREALPELFERLVTDGYLHLASPPSSLPFCFGTIGRFRASYLMNLNAQEDLRLINHKDMAQSSYHQWQSAFSHHNPRIQEMNVDGANWNAHEELDDLSDALALFIAKPKLYAQPSLLLSDIGLKSHVYATSDVNSAIREFDHASSALGSRTSASQFCMTDRADTMSGGSRFSLLHHEHGTRIDRWMTPEILTCHECETSAAKNQYLIHWNSILQQKLEELSEHNIAAVQSTNISGHDTGPLKPELVEGSVRNVKEVKSVREKSKTEASKDNAPEPAPNTDTESAGNYQEEKLMEKFNKMLVDCVFFAMPQILIFFPRYQAPKEKPAEKPAEQRLSLMAIIQHVDNQSNEKTVVVFFFVMFVSVWLLGLVLSLFGRGSRCTAAVSMLTLWTVGLTVAFIDYMLCKCLPEDCLFTWLFRGHWLAMFVGIAYIWFTYVRVPNFQSIKLSSCQLKYPGLPKFPSFQLPDCKLTYPRVPKLPSFQLPGCQRLFDLLRGWRKSPAPAVVHDTKAEDELKEPMLPV